MIQHIRWARSSYRIRPYRCPQYRAAGSQPSAPAKYAEDDVRAATEAGFAAGLNYASPRESMIEIDQIHIVSNRYLFQRRPDQPRLGGPRLRFSCASSAA